MPNVGVVADHCIRPARPLRQQGGQPPFVAHHAARGSCPVQEEMQLEGNIPGTDRFSPAGHRFRCSRLLCTRCRRRGVVYTAFRWRLGGCLLASRWSLHLPRAHSECRSCAAGGSELLRRWDLDLCFGGCCGCAGGRGRKCLNLDNRIGDGTFNVVGLSHEGRSKKARQTEILGLGANGKILPVKGLDLLPVLHAQMRNIAMDKKRAPDHLANSTTHGIRFFSDRWVRSGFSPGDVNWCGYAREDFPGVTPVIWGSGSHALIKPRVGIDAVERYPFPGFS